MTSGENVHACPECGCKAWSIITITYASPPDLVGIRRFVCRECEFKEELNGPGLFLVGEQQNRNE